MKRDMIRSSSFFGVFALAGLAAFTACGDGGLPDGPNNGKNELIIERNGAIERFDAIEFSLSNTSSTTMTLLLSGSVFGEEDVQDAGYGINLTLALSRDELLALPVPATVVVDGMARFLPQPPAIEYTRSVSASPVIDRAAITMSCFCEPREGTQKITGQLTVKKATGTQIFGSLQVTAEGNDLIEAQAEFDVDVVKPASSGI